MNYYLSVFLLDVSIPPRSGGLRNNIYFVRDLFFVVPSGWDLRIAVIIAMGRCHGRRTSRQDGRSMWATHLSLVVTAFCSRPRLKFVGGRLSKVSFMWYAPGTSILVPDPGQHYTFFPLCFQLVLPIKHNTPGLFAAACCCCIYTISLFFTFLSPPKWWLCQLGCAAIDNVFMHASFYKQGGDDILHSRRYENKQSTTTTTPVVRVCSCVTLFYT